jgi:hypothetical protein
VCQRSVGKGDGVPRVFPTLILDSGFFVPTLVLNVAVAVMVAILIDPEQCCHGFRAAGRASPGANREKNRKAAKSTKERS